MKKAVKTWKGLACLCMAGALLSGSFSAFGQEEMTEAEVQTEALGEEIPQLTLEAVSSLNGGSEKVYSHNGRVTQVDGTCSASLVENSQDAETVVKSMMDLIGASADMEFAPWREITDPVGNTYYIFQQMFENTTVCGGAIKVITDPDGNMIGMTSSVESKMPEVTSGEGISAQEAQQAVLEHEAETDGDALEVYDKYTGKVILPTVLQIDIEGTDESSRFAWVVYTNNPSEDVLSGIDLPYLAHYVGMDGEYLYSIPAITPDDETGRSGYDSSYIFEFMEPVTYTGYVDLSDGTEKEITVDVMRDTRTGMYYLGNLERRIVVGECYDFLYDDGQVVLESSRDNLEWDQVGLLSLYNYCRAYDYYKEIGWIGGDGLQTPILVLNNFCDDYYNEVNNACYIGKIHGMQCFAASSANDFSQCLDVIAHEFTHCVTGSVMTYNSYMNDYGAINEAMSDIQGKNCQMLAGDTELTDWELGSKSLTPARSMSEPHDFGQPEFTWDEYYMANVKTPSNSNDHGGVHFNSSLLNRISYLLITEGGMSLEEARIFWFMTDCAMVPQTDYAQLSELLPWVLETAGMEQYADALANAIAETRLGDSSLPEIMDEDHAMIQMALPHTEAFDAGNWMMMASTLNIEKLQQTIETIADQLKNQDVSFLPESVQDYIAQVEEEEAKKEENKPENLLEALQTAAAEVFSGEKETEASAEDMAAQEKQYAEITKDMLEWAKELSREFLFSSYGFAGQDGSTLRMIVRPGRCIPTLQHAVIREGSDQPDQIAFAVYLNGKWYDVGAVMSANEGMGKEEQEALGEEMRQNLVMIITDILGENGENLSNIQSLEDVLDLFTVDVQGGGIVELSSEGLDKIVIPEPTPAEEKEYGTIEPGKKSRPKTEQEAAETETELLDQAA